MTRGYELCKELIADGVPFSALFACNDDMALGASKALHRAGLKIPQDISLFGFDDAPSAKWLEPALSSVYLPIDNMIITAIDQAIRLAKPAGRCDPAVYRHAGITRFGHYRAVLYSDEF